MTNINFLLTISIHCQEMRLWDLTKITKEKMPWSYIKFSQLILKGNVWRSDWRICMWILGLKGLTQLSPKKWLRATGDEEVSYKHCLNYMYLYLLIGAFKLPLINIRVQLLISCACGFFFAFWPREVRNRELNCSVQRF